MKRKYTWAEHRDRCSASGLSKLAYCKRNGLSYQLFLYHLKKFTEIVDLENFQEVIITAQDINVQRPQALRQDQLMVEYCSGAILYFPERCLERVCELLNKHRSC